MDLCLIPTKRDLDNCTGHHVSMPSNRLSWEMWGHILIFLLCCTARAYNTVYHIAQVKMFVQYARTIVYFSLMETVPDLGRKYLDGNGAHAVYFNGEDCMHYLKKTYKRVCPGFEKHGCQELCQNWWVVHARHNPWTSVVLSGRKQPCFVNPGNPNEVPVRAHNGQDIVEHNLKSIIMPTVGLSHHRHCAINNCVIYLV